MCHFILELHLISNYLSSSSSLRKGHFKKASGMILTLHPIKDSQEVWNKYKVQIWDTLSEPFFFSLLKVRVGNLTRIFLCSGDLQDSLVLEILWTQFSSKRLSIPGHSVHCGKSEHRMDGNKCPRSETRTVPWKVHQRVNLHIYYHTTAPSSSTSSQMFNYFHL